MSLSAAEFVAAANNNSPLLKERAKLEQELLKLRLQRSVYERNQQDYQSQMKTLKRYIPKNESTIQKIKLDIKERVKVETGDVFRMKIGDTVYTKRTGAAPALANAIKNFTATTSAKIGEIGGFDLKARSEVAYTSQNGKEITTLNRALLQLSNHGNYTVNDSIQSMERFILKGIESFLADMKNFLAQDKSNLAEINKKLAVPFERQSEFETAENTVEVTDAETENKNAYSEIENNFSRDFILDSLKNDTGITTKDFVSDGNNIYISFEQGNKFILINEATFETFEEAVQAARYIKENFDDIDFINVSTNGHRTAFRINEDGEHFESDEIKEKISKMDGASNENAPTENQVQAETASNENFNAETENNSEQDIFEYSNIATSGLSDKKSPAVSLKNYNSLTFERCRPVAKKYNGGTVYHNDKYYFEFANNEDRTNFTRHKQYYQDLKQKTRRQNQKMLLIGRIYPKRNSGAGNVFITATKI